MGVLGEDEGRVMVDMIIYIFEHVCVCVVCRKSFKE